MSIAGLLLGGFGAIASPASATAPAKVTICHATSSTSNPYVEITVNQSSLDGGGANDHTLHTGPVFNFSNLAANDEWGDIIPPFGSLAGLNWSLAGQTVLRDGCGPPAPVDPDPCAYNTQLSTDDPTCVPPVDPDPCGSNTDLSADDPACEPPVDPDPCASNTDLSADDPACEPPVDPDPCASNTQLSADDPTCEPPLEVSPTDEVAPPTTAAANAAKRTVPVGALPRTGQNSTPLAALAACLILIGLALSTSRRPGVATERRR